MEIHPGACFRCQHDSRSFPSSLYKRKLQSGTQRTISYNTTFYLYVYKRFRKNQHQSINKNSWYSEYEWTTFQYFVNLLPQMFIVIKKVKKKKKSVYNSYWKEGRPVALRFFPHYIVNSFPIHSLEDGRKESFESTPCTRKWAKFLRAQYKGCLKSRCIIIKSDNRTIASYFLLLTLISQLH